MSSRSGKVLPVLLLAAGIVTAPLSGGGLRAETVKAEGSGGGTAARWIEEREFPPESRPVETILLYPFRLPEFIIDFLSWPLLKFLDWEEEHRIVQRTYDFFSNEDHTVVYFPYAYYVTGDKFVLGATYADSDVLDRGRKFKLSADGASGGGGSASVSYKRPGDLVSPYSLSFKAGYGLSMREKFYGVGNESDRNDQSVFQEESFQVSLDIDRLVRALPFFTPTLHLNYISEKTGESSNTGGGDSVGEHHCPRNLTGFGETADLFQYGFTLRYDTRIPFYEPYKGQKLELGVLRTDSLDGNSHSFTRYRLRFTQLFNLYRENRMLRLGFQFEALDREAEDIPFNHLSRLDGSAPLRGFPGGRFRDRGYLVFNLEYSYPVWRTKTPGNLSMLGTFFVDAGKTFSELGEMAEGTVHVSGGTGLAVSFPGEFYLRFQGAYGGEGVQFTAAFNRSF